MNLTYTANTLCAAEKSAGKPFIAMIAEMESDEGVSLTTLRALVAAGRAGDLYGAMPVVFLDEMSAGKLIDDHGTEACAEAVGKALRAYFERSVANG